MIESRRKYLDELPKIYKEKASKFLSDPDLEVVILRTDETGPWLWAVEVAGTEFWFDAFNTEREALAFCKRLELIFYAKLPTG